MVSSLEIANAELKFQVRDLLQQIYDLRKRILVDKEELKYKQDEVFCYLHQ